MMPLRSEIAELNAMNAVAAAGNYQREKFIRRNLTAFLNQSARSSTYL